MSEKVYYSTGPLENQANNASNEVWIKVLNNDKKHKAKVKVRVYRLNGHKKRIDSFKFTVDPRSSGFVISNLKPTDFQFEVQIRVIGDVDDVLIGIFGKHNGDLNPTHRLVHSELTKIDRDSFNKK